METQPCATLCEECTNLPLEFFRTEKAKTPIVSLKEAVSGCFLCPLTKYAMTFVTATGKMGFQQSFRQKTSLVSFVGRDADIVEFMLCAKAGAECMKSSRDGWLSAVEDRYRCGWAKLDLAREWLKKSPGGDPSSHHAIKYVPKRILDVGHLTYSVLDEVDKIFLVESATLHADDKHLKDGYFALSYRWGKSQTYITTKANIREHQNGISISDLPKTFQDAIIVTRQLGVRYLWIDALCIVQDVEDDWREQSATMADLYSKALMTIAAHAAADTNDGFLAYSLSEPLTLRFSNEKDGAFSLRQPSDFLTDVVWSHLNTRGWVLQERYCSARILHFAKSQIYWEDSRGILTEDYPDERPRNEGTDPMGYKRPPLVSINSAGRRGTKRPPVSPCTTGGMEDIPAPDWNDLIEHYSRCRLTRSSDRLVAIDGFVHQYARTCQWQTRYLAGAWQHRAGEDLLWYRSTLHPFTPPGNNFPESPQSQAPAIPSWSWARLDGPVNFFTNHIPPFASRATHKDRLSSLTYLEMEFQEGDNIIALKTSLVSFWMLPDATALPSSQTADTIRTDGHLHFHKCTEISFGVAKKLHEGSSYKFYPRKLEGWYALYANHAKHKRNIPEGFVSFDNGLTLNTERNTSVNCAIVAITKEYWGYAGFVAFLILSKVGSEGNQYRRTGVGYISVTNRALWENSDGTQIELV